MNTFYISRAVLVLAALLTGGWFVLTDSAAIAAAPARTVAITVKDQSFEPNSLSVNAGETIRFVVTNTSALDHEFVLGDAASQAAHRQAMAAMAGMAMDHSHAKNTLTLKPGQKGTLIWHFTTAGPIEFDCNIPGHYEAGMRGVVTLNP